MASYNLNINEYSIEELENLLSLDKSYSENDIKKSGSNLKNKLEKRVDFDNEKKNNIIFFLDTVCSKLSSYRNSHISTTDNKDIMQYDNHFIIKNPRLTNKVVEGRTAIESHPIGDINPINVSTIKKVINIDTRFRSQYYKTKSTDFTFVLPENIKKIVSMSLGTLELPNSYHAISKNQGNNSFIIQIAETGGWEIDWETADMYLVNLPDGNYDNRWSNTSFAAYIDDAINLALTSAIDIQTGEAVDLYSKYCIAYTVDRVSGRSIFAINAATNCDSAYDDEECSNFHFKLNFNVGPENEINLDENIQLKLGWQLGYRSGVYIGATAVSEGICLPSGPRYGFLCIDDFNNNVNNFFTTNYAQSVFQKNILKRINLTINQKEGVYKSAENWGDFKRNYFGPVDIQRLGVSIVDEYGRVLDLNCMDWSFTLLFECLYD